MRVARGRALYALLHPLRFIPRYRARCNAVDFSWDFSVAKRLTVQVTEYWLLLTRDRIQYWLLLRRVTSRSNL